MNHRSSSPLIFVLAVVAGSLMACGKSKLAPDTTPPAAPSELSTTTLSSSAIKVTWTAPGDDFSTGTATGYDLRYSRDAINESSFASAAPADSLPHPRPSGTPQSVIVHSMAGGTEYFFAIRARDEGGNWSGLSNVAHATTDADRMAPARVTDLTVAEVSAAGVTLQFTVTGDDSVMGRAAALDLRYSTQPMNATAWNTAIRVSPVPVPGPPGTAQTVHMERLPGRTDIHVALQVVDESGNHSLLSNIAHAKTVGGVRTWRIQADGLGDAPTIQAGIDSSVSGDTVLVEAGTYREAIRYRDKDVVVLSRAGFASTIIDGAHVMAPLVTFTGGETNRAVLEGFTLTGGHSLNLRDDGAAITSNHASPSIRRNHIVRNIASGPAGIGAGAIMLFGSPNLPTNATPILEENLIEENETVNNGGALEINGTVEATIVRNVFSRNRAGRDGGAVWVFNWARAVMNGNEFRNNVAGDHGGAIEAVGMLELTNNLFIANEAHGTDGPDNNGEGGAVSVRGGTASLRNNTFYANAAVGQDSCGGGAILLTHVQDIFIENNIFVASRGCVVLCNSGTVLESFTRNLLWQNLPFDIKFTGGGVLVHESLNINADPMFCDVDHLDFRVPASSPAVIEGVALGAFAIPGCGSVGGAPMQGWVAARRFRRGR